MSISKKRVKCVKFEKACGDSRVRKCEWQVRIKGVASVKFEKAVASVELKK